MSTFNIPGVRLPSEFNSEDMEGVDYLSMPGDMAIYRQPMLPEVEDVDQFPNVMARLMQLLAMLQQFAVQQQAITLPLAELSEQERRLVDQFLGQGEVSILIEGQHTQRIQESVLAGVWRVQVYDATQCLQEDYIEVAAIPGSVLQPINLQEVDDGAAETAELMNARPLLTEIIERNQAYVSNQDSHVINLSLLPVTEADINFLSGKLGMGGVTILSRGYGNCRITRTGLANVWWVQYFNSMDTPILNTIEITRIPEVACAAAEDISASAQRLATMLEVFE